MQKLLQELENCLATIKAPVLLSLNSGLSIAEIGNLERANKFELLPELKEIYLWKNGTHYTENGSYTLLKNGTLMSLTKAFAEYNHFINSQFEYFLHSYFPIFESIGGEFLVAECNTKSKMCGMILHYDIDNVFMTEGPTPVFDSIPTMIRSIIECYLKKAYIFSKEGNFEIDRELEREIIDAHNPKSKAYKINDF